MLSLRNMIEFVLLLSCQEVTLLALLEAWFAIIVPTPDGSRKPFEMPSARRVSSSSLSFCWKKGGGGAPARPFSRVTKWGLVLLAQAQAVTQGVMGRTPPAAGRVGRFCLGEKP